MRLTCRPQGLTARASRVRLVQRCYATQHGLGTTPSQPSAKRNAVTPFNDDGKVPWHKLSRAEKTGRATQQSFNFGLVVVGAVLTGGVGYFLYTDVFSPDSKTAFFNRAVDRIKQDPDCLALLGDSKKIEAHGDETGNKWRRARPIASTYHTDAKGNEHLKLHFYVHGPLNTGSVNVHLIRPAGQSDYQYNHFFLDVPGHARIYLEKGNKGSSSGSKNYKLFGINWKLGTVHQLKVASGSSYGGLNLSLGDFI